MKERPITVRQGDDGRIIIEPKVVNGKAAVLCDACDADYTESDAVGGIMFDSKAICPECTPKWISAAIENNEQAHVRAINGQTKSFADWVREDIR